MTLKQKEILTIIISLILTGILIYLIKWLYLGCVALFVIVSMLLNWKEFKQYCNENFPKEASEHKVILACTVATLLALFPFAFLLMDTIALFKKK